MLSIRETESLFQRRLYMVHIYEDEKKTEPSTFPVRVYGLELHPIEFIVCIEGKPKKNTTHLMSNCSEAAADSVLAVAFFSPLSKSHI